MLKISQKLEYAMRAMIELSMRRESGALVPAREIAQAQQIPVRFYLAGTCHSTRYRHGNRRDSLWISSP